MRLAAAARVCTSKTGRTYQDGRASIRPRTNQPAIANPTITKNSDNKTRRNSRFIFSTQSNVAASEIFSALAVPRGTMECMPSSDEIQVLPVMRRERAGQAPSRSRDAGKLQPDTAASSTQAYLRQVRRLRQQYAAIQAGCNSDSANCPAVTIKPIRDCSVETGRAADRIACY